MHLGYCKQAQARHASKDHIKIKKEQQLQCVPSMKLNQSIGREVNQHPMLDARNSIVQRTRRHKQAKTLHKTSI